ncbi:MULTISPECIES: phosphoribosyltransferase [Paraburkholderia]|jgi:putative phosphoribosyl transferase|uniref:phosphoribosyltransferase n=1 Tax=Paraburkholderia TaxID=1822464 RepID=UPI000349575F|nr:MULTISPECIES: phosphoribosyltransferase [Paraburkholderia]WEY37521.1 phosphoribosyltransferase [Paraburkholderia sp. SUR17]
MEFLYDDRAHAGRVLAGRLARYAGRDDVIVLGLPRGGVPVAYEVARALGAPLDVLVVRKLGVPNYPELAMGAVGPGDTVYLDRHIVAEVGVSPHEIDRVLAAERAELQRREALYRGGRAPLVAEGRTAIVVDDGMATGATMRVAVQLLRKGNAARIVVAVPVAPGDTVARVGPLADEVICAYVPRVFQGVGQFYGDFAQTADAQVTELLARSRVEPAE